MNVIVLGETMRIYAAIFRSRLKIQFRIWGYYLLIPAVLYLLIDVTVKAPELSLSLTGYVTQALIFIGLIIGYHGGLRDRRQAGEYIFVLEHSFSGKVLSFAAELCFIALVQAALLIYVLLLGILSGQEIWFFREAFMYILLYYFLPMVFCDLIGNLFSFLGEKPVLYFVLIMIGLIIGPVGRILFESIVDIVFGDKAGLWLTDFINIGQIDIGRGMDLFYGLQIEMKRFFHMLMLIFMAVAFYLILGLGLYKRRGVTHYCIPLLCITVGIIFLIRYLAPGFVQTSEASYNSFAIGFYDRMYYTGKSEERLDGSFRISKIEGEIDTRIFFSFDGRVSGKMLEDTDEIDFTLYHDLKVGSVSGEGVKGFSQKEDTVRIYFDREMESGGDIAFSLSYCGNSSPYFYSNERAVFLPAFFNYLPCPGKGYAMSADSGGTLLRPLPTYIENAVEYDFCISSANDIYTNLERQENGRFTGLSCRGVDILSSNHIRKYDYPDFEIISCIKMTDEFGQQAGESLIGAIDSLISVEGRKSSGKRTIILVPHHTLYNTVQFDYADESVVYSDAKTWSLISGCEADEISENMKEAALLAVSGFGKDRDEAVLPEEVR